MSKNDILKLVLFRTILKRTYWRQIMKKDVQSQITQYCGLLHEWNAAYEEYAKSVGLSYTSLSILSELCRNENATQKEIAENCFLPKQTVNAVITSFLRRDWVKLEELPEDRRTKTVDFTEEGKKEQKKLYLAFRKANGMRWEN